MSHHFGIIDPCTLKKGLVLHAVAVLAPAGVILLLGHSGAGKTTLGGLLSERFPIVSDDIVYLAQHKTNNKWYITDAKKVLISNSKNYLPLLATIRTYQSYELRLTRIFSRENCVHLLNAVFEAEWVLHSRTGKEASWFTSVAEIARHYPGWRLSATLNLETPQLIWDCFQ
jgi:ABC-type glutathione transport system ATPase component